MQCYNQCVCACVYVEGVCVLSCLAYDFICATLPEVERQLFHTCETPFIFGEKCPHFSALYSVNALYIFQGEFYLVTPFR